MTTTPAPVIHGVLSSSDWGPATWAAIAAATATVILAAFTYWLARETRQLARETAEDLQAAWRPVLVPAERAMELSPTDTPEFVSASLAITNGGRGPALNIEAACFSASSLQTFCTDPMISLGTLSPEGTRKFSAAGLLRRDIARNDSSWLHYYVVLSYEDLGGREYMSRFLYVAWDAGQDGASDGAEQRGLAVTLVDTGQSSGNPFATPPGLWDLAHDPNTAPEQKPEPDWRRRLRANHREG